jgi:hypothetical protein
MNSQIKTVVIPSLPNQITSLEMFSAFGPIAYAIPSEGVRTPFLSVSRFLDDSFAVIGGVREHAKMFATFGITPDHVEVLEHRVAGLKAVHNLWIKERTTGLKQNVETALVQGEALRHEVLGYLRVAFRKNTQLMNNLSALSLNDSVDAIHTDLEILQSLMVDAKNIFAAQNIDVKDVHARLDTCVSTLEKGLEGYVPSQTVIQLQDLRDRMYTLAVDSAFGITDCAWAAFGLDRTNNVNKTQWATFATMADYGWSL